jgi:hypothetical protein
LASRQPQRFSDAKTVAYKFDGIGGDIRRDCRADTMPKSASRAEKMSKPAVPPKCHSAQVQAGTDFTDHRRKAHLARAECWRF